jgi:hypothetical protein
METSQPNYGALDDGGGGGESGGGASEFETPSGSHSEKNIPSQDGDTQKTDQSDRKVNFWAE